MFVPVKMTSPTEFPIYSKHSILGRNILFKLIVSLIAICCNVRNVIWVKKKEKKKSKLVIILCWLIIISPFLKAFCAKLMSVKNKLEEKMDCSNIDTMGKNKLEP